MKICPSCRKEYSDGHEVCKACCLPLMPRPETTPCPSCGEPVPVSASKCLRCGAYLDEEPSEDGLDPVEADELTSGASDPADEEVSVRPVPATRGRPKAASGGCQAPLWILVAVLYVVVRFVFSLLD